MDDESGHLIFVVLDIVIRHKVELLIFANSQMVTSDYTMNEKTQS